MKRKVGIKLFLGVGILLIMCSIIFAAVYYNGMSAYSVSVIGGADGPTSVFLAGKTGTFSSGGMLGFVITALCGIGLIVFGIVVRRFKKPVSFWNVQKKIEVTDVRAYNRSVGLLWICYGMLLIVFGIPMLAGQNSALIVVSILGIVFLSIGMMGVYTVIEGRYRKQ